MCVSIGRLMVIMGLFFRVKKAEECFKQAREKASYNVKPKHATGIVRTPPVAHLLPQLPYGLSCDFI